MKKIDLILVLLLCAGSVTFGSASAAIISYNLSDKAPGGLADPDYGLRLDDLFTTPTDSNWTFSFTSSGANVQMDVDTVAMTARIFGTVFGGRDGGSDWVSGTTASWEIDFLYSDGMTVASDGYWAVDYNANNFGWLKLLDDVDLDGDSGSDKDKYIALADYHGGSFVANGGPAPSGPFVSAWLESTDGFIASNTNLSGETYVRPNNDACCKDFGFRAARVPEPASLFIMGIGLLGLAGSRRRS